MAQEPCSVSRGGSQSDLNRQPVGGELLRNSPSHVPAFLKQQYLLAPEPMPVCLPYDYESGSNIQRLKKPSRRFHAIEILSLQKSSNFLNQNT